MFSTFIVSALLFQLFARNRVGDRDREKQQSKNNHQQVHVERLTNKTLERHMFKT
jgi:hypothetical protein